ncbi:MAG: hypothetical protein ACR2H4_04935 [Pyrinomonadaceae bacterium]
MPKQTDYTPEEWKTISAAPVMAGLLVTVSDLSGPIGTAKEAIAVVRGVIDAATGTSNELIKAVAEGIKAQGGKPDMPALPNDRAAVRTALIDGCKRALTIVSQKSPGEAEEYKQWLTSLAQKTAEASKEGGFLGIGGVQISDDEKAAVKELSSALDLSTRTSGAS